MRPSIEVFGATIISALVAAISFGIGGHSLGVGIIAFVLALLWVILLGVPAYLVFRSRGWVRWWSMALAGFVLGALPSALFGWPYHPGIDSGYSAWDGHEMVVYEVHGVPTHAGWVSFFNSTGAAGLLGAVSAFVFWLALVPIARSGRQHK